MTTSYATLNPLGSSSIRDFSDNASNIDEAANSPSPSFKDRFGKRRQTWAGFEAAFDNLLTGSRNSFDAFLLASGYTYLADYAAGVTITSRVQYVLRDGVPYRVAASQTLPLTLTGNWATDSSKLVAFNADALLRQDLASVDINKGASLVRGAVRSLSSFAELSQLSAFGPEQILVTGFTSGSASGGGFYVKRQSPLSNAVVPGIRAVTAFGEVYELKHSGSIAITVAGADPTGAIDSAAACQAVSDYIGSIGGGEILVPSGSFDLGSTGFSLPAQNVQLRGYGQASRLFGNAASLVRYPLAVQNTDGEFVTQDVKEIYFKQTGDGICIKCHQTWTSSAKIGPSIANNHFEHSSPTTRDAKSISLRGIWAGQIYKNQSVGAGSGGGPTDGKGGYGIYFDLNNNMTSSVMNLKIESNSFNTIAYPIFMPDRSGDGRVEGMKIFGNILVAGSVGIRTSQTLATSILANQVSDFANGILSVSDFDITIASNSEVTGSQSGINIIAADFGITERIVIANNNMGTGVNGRCIRVTNTIGDDVVRNLVITGNTHNANNLGGTIGIAFEGAFRVNGVQIKDNVFGNMVDGVNFGGAIHQNVSYGGSSFNNVTNRVIDTNRLALQASRSYGDTRNINLAGGAQTERVDVSIVQGFFQDKPVWASLNCFDNLSTGYYNYALSTPTNLVFTLKSSLGGNLVGGMRQIEFIAHALNY